MLTVIFIKVFSLKEVQKMMHFAGDLRMFENLISRISMDNDGRHSTVGVEHQMVNRRTQQLDPAENHQGYSQPNHLQGYSQLYQHQGYSQPNQQQGYSQPHQQQEYSKPNHLLDYSQLTQHEGYSQPGMPSKGQHQHIYSEPNQTSWPAMEPNQAKVKCDKHEQIVHETVNYVSDTKHLYIFMKHISNKNFRPHNTFIGIN